MLTDMRKRGELDRWLVLDTEKRRFEKEGTIPDPPDPEAPEQIQKLQGEYHAAVRTASLQKSRRILELAQRFDEQLEALKRRLTQESRIDAAIAVKQAQARIYDHPAVSAAEFAVAALSGEDSAEAPQEDGAAPDRWEPCPTCLGKGSIPSPCIHCDGKGICIRCSGVGKIPAAITAGHRVCLPCKGSGKCRYCDGTGSLNEGNTCPDCLGRGRVQQPE